MKITSFFNIKRILGLTRKEIAIIIKDKAAMVIIFMIPTVLIISANYGRQNSVIEPPKIGLCDLDNSEGSINIDYSQEFVNLVIEYHVKEEITVFLNDNQTLLLELLGKGKLDAIMIIHDGFEHNISVGYPAIIEVQVDSLNIFLFLFTQEKIDSMVTDFKEEYEIKGVFQPDITLFLRPKHASRLFDVAPFFFPWTLFSIATLVACQVVVSDVPKHRMALTPTNKFEISISKIAGIQALLSIVCLELMILSFMFGFDIIGSILIYFFVLWIVSLAGVTLGFMLSTFAKTPLAALQFFIFFFLLQAIVIFFIPWDLILYIFPVYNGKFLMLNAVIRGQPLIDFYLMNVIIFIFITFIVGYIKYRRLTTLV